MNVVSKRIGPYLAVASFGDSGFEDVGIYLDDYCRVPVVEIETLSTERYDEYANFCEMVSR